MTETLINRTPRLPKAPLAGVIAVALGLAGVTAARIFVLRDLFDLIRDLGVGGEWLAEGLLLGALLGAIALVAGWLRGREWALSDKIGLEHAHQWRMVAYRSLQTTAPEELQRRGQGAVLLRFVGDLGGLGTWAARGVAQGLAAIAVILAAILTLSLMSPRLGVTLFVLNIATVVIARWAGHDIGLRAAKVRKKRARLANRIADHISHIGVIQLFGRTSGERSRVERASRRMTDDQVSLAAARAKMRALAETMAGLTAVAIVLVGASEVAAGTITSGTVVAAVLVTRQLASPLRRLMQFHDYRERGLVARRRIESYLESDDVTVASRRPVSRGPATISLKSVSVAGRLESITAEVTAGSRIAVVGASGSGKSSLLAVMAGFLTPDQGRVRIDGHTVSDSSGTRRRIGMVGPGLPLLRESISRNIKYRDKNTTDTEVDDIIERLGLQQTLAARPNGLATRVLDDGQNLSTGERRRLEFARALVGSPDLLLLDEPLAGLDPDSRQIVADTVDDFAGTVVFTTSDPAEAAGADAVWELDAGRLASSATPVREAS